MRLKPVGDRPVHRGRVVAEKRSTLVREKVV